MTNRNHWPRHADRSALPQCSSIKSDDEARKNRIGKVKAQDLVPTVKANMFSSYLAGGGTFYNCHAEADNAGPLDFYLINTNSWTYTFIGSTSGSTNYIDFYVNKPSTYGQYRVWFEGPNESGYTGYQAFGDPYTGVTLSSGKLYFSSTTDMENLYNRLYQAYEDHSSAFFDSNSSLTDDQLDALITSTGFDEDYPLRDFEAYFGFSSLRTSLAAGEQLYLDGTISTNPDNNAPSDDIVTRLQVNLQKEGGCF